MTRPPIAEGLPHTSEREPGRTAYSTGESTYSPRRRTAHTTYNTAQCP